MKHGPAIAKAAFILAASASLITTATTVSAQGLRDLIGDRTESRGDLRDLILDRLASREALRDLLRDRLEGRSDHRDLISDRLAGREDLRDLLKGTAWSGAKTCGTSLWIAWRVARICAIF